MWKSVKDKKEKLRPWSNYFDPFQPRLTRIFVIALVQLLLACTGDNKQITDASPPIATLFGPESILVRLLAPYLDQGVTAFDDEDGSLSVTIAGEVDTAKAGVYQLTYAANDTSGNRGVVIPTDTVERDTTPPMMTLLGENPMVLKEGEDYNDPGATAIDDVDGELPIFLMGDVDTSIPGVYAVIYSASDSAGNESDKIRIVNVEEDYKDACVTPTIPSLVDAPFEIVIAKSEVAMGETVDFSISAEAGIELSNYHISWFVDDPEGIEPSITGQTATYVYYYPGRFRIVATLTHRNYSEDSIQLINYVNVCP